MMSHQAGQDRTQPASSVQWRAPWAQQPASPPRQPPIWPPLPLPSLGPFTPNQVVSLGWWQHAGEVSGTVPMCSNACAAPQVQARAPLPAAELWSLSRRAAALPEIVAHAAWCPSPLQAALLVAYTFMVSVSWGAWTIGKQVEGLKLEIHEMSRDVGARQQSDLSAQLDQLSAQIRRRGALLDQRGALLNQRGAQLDQLSTQMQQQRCSSTS